MQNSARCFEDAPAVRRQVPLLLGVTGPSGSGKTFSALELATGMQRAMGGEIFVIDTEARRALHYADRFKFRHVDFQAPFGPLDYLAAIEHCVKQGAKILVIDSMTHEHNGVGGVMDQVERHVEERIARHVEQYPNEPEWKLDKKRAAWNKLGHIRPKGERRTLNTRIVQLGVNAVFCYRATDRLKYEEGKEPEKLGWQPETTSRLTYEMTQMFLLGPSSDGRPVMQAATDAEKLLTKNPAQFRGWFTPGFQLDAALGEKLARWAMGGEGAPPAKPRAVAPEESPETRRDAILAAIEMAPSQDALAELRALGGPRKYQTVIVAAFDARSKELAEELADPENFDR